MAQYNIQCNGIGPGYIADPADRAPARAAAGRQPCIPLTSFISAKTPADALGQDGGPPGRRRCSSRRDASNFVNGHILYVDGGILAYIGKQP